MLIKKGVKINVLNTDRDTPLHCAVSDYNVEVAKVLITRGAKTDTRNQSGDTALDQALRWNRTEIVKLMKGD